MAMTYDTRVDIPHTSLMNNATPFPMVSNGGTNVPTHKIQGKMLVCEKLISQEQFEQLDKNGIKSVMVTDMVRKMLEDECIEFTMQQTNPVDQMVRVRARVFVTPDSQVRLLRENGVK